MYLIDIQLEEQMAKKQTQFRFEEDFLSDISKLASGEGQTISEVVRNALKTYIAIYERTKKSNSRLYIVNTNNNEKTM